MTDAPMLEAPGQEASARLDIPTLPLIGRRLIEASAGTGKTFTLAALYLRLVMGPCLRRAEDATGNAYDYPRPLMPPEILVVTFTEAATEELRARIGARLKEARDALLGRSEPDGVLRSLLDAVAPGEHLACAQRLDGAARLMDEAAIYTIHGFCQRMLKRHAFDSGSLFAAELVADARRLFDAVVEDYWRQTFYPLSASLQAAISEAWKTPAELGEAVRVLLHGGRPQPLLWADEHVEAPADLAQALGALETSRQALEAAAEQARHHWRDARDAIEALLRDAIAAKTLNANQFKAADLEGKLEALAQWAAGSEPGLPAALLDSKGQAWCGQTRLDGAAKKGASAPRHALFAALDALIERQAAQPDWRPWVLAHARDRLTQALADEKRRRGQWDFDDLLNGLDDALRGPAGPRLAARIRHELPVAMIDEFQDTDPVQYRIFSSVYSPPQRDQGDPESDAAAPCTLLMIGDPKQAIYAFRGADIHTYLAARRATPSRYTLDRNFRSTQAMVTAVNRLFQCARIPFRSAEIPFVEVRANDRDEHLLDHGITVPALTLWLPRETSSMAVGDYRTRMAEATRADIQHLLEGGDGGTIGFASSPEDASGLRGVKPADIAILVRTGREADLIREALDAGGIKSVYLSQKTSVFASREAFWLLQLFEAVAHPRDDRRLRAALATRLLSDSLVEVAHIGNDEAAWETMVERFTDYHQLWWRRGVLPMLRAVMRDFCIGERLLSRSDGERRLTDLLHLGELAQAASQKLDGEQALLRWWHRALDGRFEEGLDPEGLVQRLESDETLVRVVTIHKSKGLQYPIVYLPFICDYREVDSKAQYCHVPLAAQGAASSQPERGVALKPSASQRRIADEERLSEDLRLLYVALTRAEFACRLGLAPLYKGRVRKGEAEDATTLIRSAIGALLAEGETSLGGNRLRECLAALVDDRCVALCPPPTAEPRRVRLREPVAALHPARRFAGRIDRDWWIASYSALLEGARRPDEAEDGGTEPVPDSPETGSGLDVEVIEERTPVPQPPVRTLRDFPRGPRAGTFLHGLLEALDFDCLGRPEYDAGLVRLIRSRLVLNGYDVQWEGVLHDWLTRVLPAALGPEFHLGELGAWKAEVEFWLPASQAWSQQLDRLVQQHEPLPGVRPRLAPRCLEGMLKGYIDLVFEVGGRWYVLDWKSNHLGDTPEDYNEAAMVTAMVDHRYDLQYVIYLLALHRLLKSRLADYDYDTHVGGVFYAFLRGMQEGGGSGVWHRRPERELIEALDAWLESKSSRMAVEEQAYG
ncbi:exodeoxyribonuclease V subunit beta [Halomonas sp. WWR20]